MFPARNLDTDGLLQTVWKAAYDITIEKEDEECDLPKICRNIDTWVCSDAYEIDRRLSLKTSATLISGAAKLYKSGLCKLFEDIKTLDENMSHRKRRLTNNLRSSSRYDSSECAATPEQTRHQVSQNFDTSYTASKRIKANPDCANNTSNCLISRLSVENTPINSENCSNNESVSESLSNNRNGSRSMQVEDLETSTEKKTRDQEVQTSPAIYRPEADNNSLEEDGLDMNLPFGYILVHDNYHSRIPSKIILSSINSDIMSLI